MEKNKKLQAAIAGVMYYLQAEEQQAAEPLVTPSYPVPWALQGRQTMMNYRALVQRRILKR